MDAPFPKADPIVGAVKAAIAAAGSPKLAPTTGKVSVISITKKRAENSFGTAGAADETHHSDRQAIQARRSPRSPGGRGRRRSHDIGSEGLRPPERSDRDL